jgi:hypothetical protein
MTVESNNSSLFDEFVCKLGLFWHEWAILWQITILPTKMSDFHRQSEFETIVNG